VRKALIAILAFLYLAVASGIEMNIHYCMGEVASVEFGSPEKSVCGKCGMESKKGCCDDETKFVKIEDSHQLSQPSWTFFSHASLPAPTIHEYSFAVLQREINPGEPSHGPPLWSETPLYIKYCVYRI